MAEISNDISAEEAYRRLMQDASLERLTMDLTRAQCNKPRIRLASPPPSFIEQPAWPKFWECDGWGCFAIGQTPADAFRKWHRHVWGSRP